MTLLIVSNFWAFGVTPVVIGIVLRWYVGRKRFNRRGVGGLQHFSNYESAVATAFFEKLLNILGLILIIVGLLICLAEWSIGKKERPKTQQPSHTSR